MAKEELGLSKWIVKIAINIFGLFLCGVAIVMAVECGLGATPWDVLQAGMTNYLPITLGQASQIIAFILVIFTWYKGVIPGVGTILNAYFIGFFIDFTYKVFKISTPDSMMLKIIMLVVSVVMLAFGIVISLTAKIGVGSRDALMEYLLTSSTKSVVFIRASLEIGALIIGVLLKGPYGIGSILSALTLGYIIQFAAKIFNYNFDIKNHYTLGNTFENLKLKRNKGLNEKTI